MDTFCVAIIRRRKLEVAEKELTKLLDLRQFAMGRGKFLRPPDDLAGLIRPDTALPTATPRTYKDHTFRIITRSVSSQSQSDSSSAPPSLPTVFIRKRPCTASNAPQPLILSNSGRWQASKPITLGQTSNEVPEGERMREVNQYLLLQIRTDPVHFKSRWRRL